MANVSSQRSFSEDARTFCPLLLLLCVPVPALVDEGKLPAVLKVGLTRKPRGRVRFQVLALLRSLEQIA